MVYTPNSEKFGTSNFTDSLDVCTGFTIVLESSYVMLISNGYQRKKRKKRQEEYGKEMKIQIAS